MRLALAISTVASTFALALPAFAQDTSPAAPPSRAPATSVTENRALAESLFSAGRRLMEVKRYAEACVKLSESYRLDPAAGTLLNLAVCHEHAGLIASAWGEFRQALSEARRSGRADREELAAEHIKAIEAELPMITIAVPSSARVRGLEVLRNGVPLSSAAWATELPVDPGDVEIIARAPGYKSSLTTVSIARAQRLEVSLQPLEAVPVTPPPLASTDSMWTGRRKLAFVLAGAGIAAVGVGAVFGVSALRQRASSDGDCPVFDNERRCTASGSAAMSSASTSAWISDIALGAGAVAVLAGGYLWLTGSNPSTGRSAAGGWSWDVSVGSHSGFGVATKSF